MTDRQKHPRTWGGVFTFFVFLLAAPFGIAAFFLLYHVFRWAFFG